MRKEDIKKISRKIIADKQKYIPGEATKMIEKYREQDRERESKNREELKQLKNVITKLDEVKEKERILIQEYKDKRETIYSKMENTKTVPETESLGNKVRSLIEDEHKELLKLLKLREPLDKEVMRLIQKK